MLVSAIMPTARRPEMALRALECFDAQDWTEKEIVIADDDRHPSFPAGLERAEVTYFRLDSRIELGAKRNICCGRASGEVIFHWDDDDWSAPGRILDQVWRLIRHNKMVTGYNAMLFEGGGERWQYLGGEECTLGTSLCYYRRWWAEHPFLVQQIGEDGAFVRDAMQVNQLAVADARDLMTASIHAGNTSPRQLKGSNWTRL